MTTALASMFGYPVQHLGPIAMDAHQFHHHEPVTSFDDAMDLCVDDDVIKHEPPPPTSRLSPPDAGLFPTTTPRDAGFSPAPPPPPPPPTAAPSDGGAFVPAFQEDKAGGNSFNVVSRSAPGIDPDVVEAAIQEALRLGPAVTSPASGIFAVRGPGGPVRYSSGGVAGPRPSPGQCKVCGDEATGMYFGALVCVPCKTFFLRYAGDGFSFVCKANKDCEISVATRTQCKYCRYQKCLRAGMYRRVRPAQVQLSAGQQLCVVCHDVANGIHFGAITCEGCKKFFRRGLTEHTTYVCKSGQNCVINPRTRNSCRYCRFQMCLHVGMSREAIQMGRPSKLCGTEGTATTPQQPRSLNVLSSSALFPGTVHAAGFLAISPHAAASASALAGWRPADDRLAEWALDQRRASDGWSADYSDSGTGGLLTDDAGSLEPSPKRRHSESYASSSSPYQFSSPPGSGSGSSVDLRHTGPRSGSADSSRQSSMSSQEYVPGGGGPWPGTSSPATTAAYGAALPLPATAAPASTTSFGVGALRMSGGEMLQRVPAAAARQNPGGVYVHWPLPTATSVVGTVKLEGSNLVSPGNDVGAFHGREMSDVLEHIIRQQQQQTSQNVLPGTSTSTVPQGVVTPGSIQDSLQSYLVQTSAGGSGLGAFSGFPGGPTTFPAADPTAAGGSAASMGVDLSSDWIDQLSDDLAKDAAVSVSVAGFGGQGEHQSASAVSNDEPDPEIEAQVQASMSYWLHPELPDENVMLADRHWDVLNRVVPAYNRFVQFGTNVNRKLKIKFDEWSKQHPDGNKQELSAWIQSEVVPIYTVSSITYFKCLPGFNELSAGDQGILVRLGQSQSRILVAALHWYDPEEHNFRHFLSWRELRPGQIDHFKQRLIDYATRLSTLELDPIEAALLNVLTVMASDYPGLEGTSPIEQYRKQILGTFRAYTTAKFGTPNTRLETLFEYIPDVRRLGLWHYKMTTHPSLGVSHQQQQQQQAVTSS